MSRPAPSRDVLRAAARIVADRGPEGLTMDRLARATSLSRATLYRQTGGREAVLDALAASGAEVGDRAGTRERILRAARDVFARAGFEAGSIDEIAAAAGVGAVTVYRHFGDKEGLVQAFMDEVGPRRAAREASASPTDDVRKDLERFAERLLVAIRDDAPLVRLVLLETLHGSPMLRRVREKSPMRMIVTLAGLVAHHAAAGRLRAEDPRVLAQSFAGMLFVSGLVGPILRGDPAPDPVSTARSVTDLFLRGALPDRRPGR